MMKLSILALAPVVAVSLAATTRYKEKFFMSFEHNDPVDNPICGIGSQEEPCPKGDDLSVPVKALKWNQVGVGYHIGKFDGVGSLYATGPYDGFFYGDPREVNNATSIYPESCVDYWQLDSFAAGCATTITGTLSNGQVVTVPSTCDCSFEVEGLDKHGRCVGREHYYFDSAPVSTNFFGFAVSSMDLFNTTRGGLRGKKLATIRFRHWKRGTKPNGFNQNITFGATGFGMDALTYTVYNRTKCS